MKKFSTAVIVSVLAMFLVAGSVWATAIYSPVLSQINHWGFMYATNNSGTSGGVQDFSGASENDVNSTSYYRSSTDNPYDKFVVNFEQGTSSYNGTAQIGYDETVDLSAFSDYELSVANVNENTWDYALYVANIDDSSRNITAQYSSTPVTLKNGTSTILDLDLSSANSTVDLTKAYIGFSVGDTLPTGTDHGDWTSESKVAPVPEPATILLMGFGLLGLGIVGRKKLGNKPS